MNQESIIEKYVPYSDALKSLELEYDFRLLELSLVQTLDYLSSRFSVVLWYDHFSNPSKKSHDDMLFKVRSSTTEIMWVYCIYNSRSHYISVEVDADRVASIRSTLSGFFREQERNAHPTLKLFFSKYSNIEDSLVTICDCLDSASKNNPTGLGKSDINAPKRPNAYLLTWNPNYWDFEGGLSAFVEKVHSEGSFVDEWAVSNGHIQVGDIVYLMKLGVAPRGIVASGEVIEGVHFSKHFDSEKAKQGIEMKTVTVRFTSAVELDDILDWNSLKNKFPEQKWTPQSSGVLIKREYYEGLEDEWLRHVNSSIRDVITSINTPLSPKSKNVNEEGVIQYMCGRCQYTFLKSKRCPECGQLVKE